MSELIPPPPSALAGTHCTAADYERLYRQSIENPESFWREQLARIDWVEQPTRIADWSYDPVDIRWFEDGVLNLCYNCVDRHLTDHADDVAILWEGDEPGVTRSISYAELHAEVVRMANVLKLLGAQRGDRITIYMPMIVDAAVAMLACARIGAVHSVVFGGFSPEALRGRIQDCGSRIVITADGGARGGRLVPLKANVDEALRNGPGVDAVIVVQHAGNEINMIPARDHWYHEIGATVPDNCPCEPMGAEDPLFILYTSGSTGAPKGVLHTTGGYSVWVTTTFHYVFDYRPGEIFWCTADVGWVTGHSYVVYGPLANAATTLLFESLPTYPDAGRCWDVIERHRVNVFYTAPTAIRALEREGDAPVRRHDRSSLRLLGSVGEPINPAAWQWYHDVVGDGRCAVVDTWWQTETGGIMITTLPGAHVMKPGSAGKPFFGVVPLLVDGHGKPLEGPASGNLCLAQSWPGQMRTVYGDHDRFEQTYFTHFKGRYFTGDGCRRDGDGYYWITGRVDDVINVSGHRIGTAEIESALVAHPLVAEAAVVGYPHEIKGQGIYCYVTLNADAEVDEALVPELKQQVRKEIGPIATPDHLHFTPALPKTRSGKIMRRILRKIAENDFGSLGDTSTLADPSLVETLVAERRNR
jgi:acetyl-CoA synthetase